MSCGRKYNQEKKFESFDDFERDKYLKTLYRSQCSFKFSLNSFPDEFDFGLIETMSQSHSINPICGASCFCF